MALVPIGFVTSTIVSDLGWSWRSLVGVAGLITVYALVIVGERATMSPQTDGWRLRRGVRLVIAIVASAAFLIPAAGAGIR